MKSQHRHDLQTNELGKVADKVAGSLGGFFETYGNRVLIGVCVAMVAASLVIYKVRRDRNDEAVAWRDLASARNAEEYAGVWERHPSTAAGRWARVHEGESRLTEGVQLLFSSVESGTKELKLAREALQALVDQKGAPAEIRERALFALARCLEALSDGSETEAVKTYQALLREFPATIYKKDAEDRIEALNSGSGQEFYAWFAKFPRPKPSEKRPRDRKTEEETDMEAPLIDPAADENAAKSDGPASDPLKVPVNGESEKEASSETPATDNEKKGDDAKPDNSQSRRDVGRSRMRVASASFAPVNQNGERGGLDGHWTGLLDLR